MSELIINKYAVAHRICPVSYTHLDVYKRQRLESASGSVFAKVRRDFEVSVPLDGTEKAYTGRKSEKKTLTFFSFDVNLFTNSGIPYELYDTIETKENVYLFDAVELPICVRRIRYEEYAQKEAHISEDEARCV